MMESAISVKSSNGMVSTLPPMLRVSLCTTRKAELISIPRSTLSLNSAVTNSMSGLRRNLGGSLT